MIHKDFTTETTCDFSFLFISFISFFVLPSNSRKVSSFVGIYTFIFWVFLIFFTLYIFIYFSFERFIRTFQLHLRTNIICVLLQTCLTFLNAWPCFSWAKFLFIFFVKNFLLCQSSLANWITGALALNIERAAGKNQYQNDVDPFFLYIFL